VNTTTTKIFMVGCWLALASHGLTQQPAAPEFWVAREGSDQNAGTKEQPLASPAAALRKARELRRLAQAPTNQPVRILLRSGLYPLDGPLLIRPEDSGTDASPTSIEAAPGERPFLSGGVNVQGWHKPPKKIPGLPAAAQKQIWMADAPKFSGRILEIRQLWVNGQKAIRARTPNGDTLERLVEWNRTNEQACIPSAVLSSLPADSQLEMVIHQQWEIAVLRVKSLQTDGAKARVTFQQPESRIQFEHPWPAPVMRTNYHSPFFLANAIQFLDQPGEWFQQLPGGEIYYWPQPGEDLTHANVIVPALETLVQIDGTLDRPVSNVRFEKISFAYTTWLRPSQSGHVPLQAGMFMRDAYRLSPKKIIGPQSLDNQAWIGRPPAAVSVQGANTISFERCRFEHLAATGLDFVGGTHDDTVEGCTFRDVGGNGLQLGKFQTGGIETHVPYLPADEREICTRERIANNLFTDCATEDWGCVGVGIGYAREVAIEHNEVNNLPYTGISLGWGWTRATNALSDNRVRANHVHDIGRRLCDLGGIYTLSAQPGTIIDENSIHDIRLSPYVHDSNHWFYVYLDEGSSFITVRDNWCPEPKFMKNANGPGNVWTNNGPLVPDTIKDAAGLEPAFRDLLREPANSP
jgi:hypothetical protein